MPEISSPFFNPDRPSTVYLDRIPKWAWPYTCRCRKIHGMVLDVEREMMVCEVCRLPQGFQVLRFNDSVVGQCISCGDDFVKWNKRLQGVLCLTCGGDNAAEKGKRTKDPHDRIDEEFLRNDA